MGRGTLRQPINICLSFCLLLAPVSLLVTMSCLPGSAKKSAPKSGAAAANGAAPGAVPDVPAKPDGAPPAIGVFEQRLFFRTYSDEELPSRLDRIEKQIFGESTAASVQERVQRVEQVLREQQAEDAKKQEAEAFRAAKQQAATQKSAPARGTGYGAPPTQDDDEVDRARSAIQAARDQEIAGLLGEGVSLYRQKRGNLAIEKFEQALRLDPTNAEAHFNMGIIEESMGNYVEALASYKQAAVQEADNKEYKEAVAAVERKANVQQKTAGHRADLKALAESANAAWKRGEYLSALDLYQQLDVKEPNRALVKYNIGSIYLMLKDPTSALGYYKQATKLEPGEAKYGKAYQELAAEAAKAQKAQARIDQETAAEYAPQQGQPPVSKGKKKSAQKGAPQGSSFAPYMVVGGGAPGAPANYNAGGKMGRTSFGIPANMSGQFTGTPSGAINGLTAMPQNSQGVTMMPQGRPVAQQQQQQPQQQQQNTMLSYGMIGQSNNEGGVTLTQIGIASRAATAGLVPGDIIQTVDGFQVSRPDEINQILSRSNPAQRIPLVILRGGNLAVVNM